MMLDYVNLLVEFVIMSMPILSRKDNHSTFIPNSYICVGGGGGDIYIYIRVQLFPFFLLLLIVIYDCVGKYNKVIIMNLYVGQWWRIMSTYLLNLLQCPFPSFLSKEIITILLFKPVTYNKVMLLIALYNYNGAVRWQCNNCSWWCCYQYWISGVMNNASPNGNHKMIKRPLHLPLLSWLLLLLLLLRQMA